MTYELWKKLPAIKGSEQRLELRLYVMYQWQYQMYDWNHEINDITALLIVHLTSSLMLYFRASQNLGWLWYWLRSQIDNHHDRLHGEISLVELKHVKLREVTSIYCGVCLDVDNNTFNILRSCLLSSK
jgi:hypothetical protein